MVIFRNAAAVTAAIVTGAAPVVAQAPTAKPLDVAGVRPGMTADAALALLKRDGWSVQPVEGDTWDETVARAVDRRRGTFTTISAPKTGIGGYKASKGEESVSVEVHPTPQGGEVGTVSYRAPWAGRPFEQLRADLHRRYGTPTFEPPAGRQGRIVYQRQGRIGPVLSFEPESGGPIIQLTEGVPAEQAWLAAVDRAVSAKLGTPKTSF